MRIQLKHTQTQVEWEDSYYVLAQGEAGVALDTGAVRIGNGVDRWADLPTTALAVQSVAGRTGNIILSKEDIGEPGTDTGLDRVDNTPDIDKVISGPQQEAIAAINARIDTLGDTSGITKETIGLGNVDNTSDLSKPISNATQLILNTKAPVFNPTFTGNVIGVTKSMVGLAQADNTSDINKPISSATQNALNQKASSADIRFTDTRTPTAGSVVNASVSASAAISLDKTADTATRIAMTPAERVSIAASDTVRQGLSIGVIKAGPDALSAATDFNTPNASTVAVGARALKNATTARSTTALGVDAMSNSVKSIENVGIGSRALLNINSSTSTGAGQSNVAIGVDAARNVTSAVDTVSIGKFANAGRNNSRDIAVGSYAQTGNLIKGLTGSWEYYGSTNSSTDEVSNIAIGSDSLTATASDGSSANIGLGAHSLRSLNKATGNVALGYNTLQRLGSDSGPTQLQRHIVNANGTYDWSGTTLTLNITEHGMHVGDIVNIALSNGEFTSDAVSNNGAVRGLVSAIVDTDNFTVEESQSGTAIQSRIDAGDVTLQSYERGSYSGVDTNNLAVGYNAGTGLVSGVNNIFVGSSAGPSGEVTMDGVVSVGAGTFGALEEATDALALGTAAGAEQRTAIGTVLIGNRAATTTDGSRVVVVGTDASGQSDSVVVGDHALSGASSVVVGAGAIGSSESVVIGSESSITDGSGVALGYDVTVSGDGSTAVGNESKAGYNSVVVGQGSEAGDNSIVIGSDKVVDDDTAQFADDSQTTNISGSIVNIGTTAEAPEVTVGNEASNISIGTSNAGGTVSIKAQLVTVDDVAVTSDQRDKTGIRPTQLGLDFINKIEPVEYRWSRRNEDKDGRRFHQGVIAQQVQSVIEETGTDFGGFIDQNVNGGPDQLLVRYDEFVAPLIKSVQELSAKVTELEKRLNG